MDVKEPTGATPNNRVTLSKIKLNTLKKSPSLPDRLPRWLSGRESDCNAGDTGDEVQSLGWEDPPEEEMATHSCVLAWKIP